MAKDIDIGLPDGGEITVPAWSTEETQKQIYILLKSMDGVNKDTVKKLEEAQRADNKNSKKEIEALKDLSDDLKESNKAGFLGAMAMAAGAAGGALGLMGKAVGVTAGAVTIMGGALVAGAKGVTSFATAYTDAIKPLAETGIAFGDMGGAINQSVKDLNTLGFSSEEAAKLINNSGTAFLRMGADGLGNFTKAMKVTGKQFERFGMTTDEATEYVATEIEERARAGIVDKLSATQMANLQMNILNDQIKATRRLGKSVDEIADFQKQVKDDPRIAGIISAFSGNSEQQRMIESLVTQLQSVPGLDGTDVADIIAAEMEGRSIESTDAYQKVVVALAQTPGALEGFTTSVGESFRAVAENNTSAFQSAQDKFDRTLTESGKTIVDLQQRALAKDRDAQGRMTVLNDDPASQAFVGQAAVLAGLVDRVEETKTDLDDKGNVILSDMLKTATEFDNVMLKITGAFTEQVTRSQQAMVDGLGAITTALDDSGLDDMAVKAATKLGDLAEKGIKEVTGKMGDLATDFANFSTALVDIYGEKGIGGVAERIYQASVDNIIKPIGDAILGLFTSPAVVTALVAAVAIPFAAQVVATSAAMAITNALMGGGGGTDVNNPGTDGGAGSDKDGKAKGGGRFGGRGAFLAGGAATALMGVMEAMELAGDITDINKDLKEGAITRSEASIARTTEITEGVGGTAMGVGGAMAAGAALGSMGMPVVGTAIGAMVAGGIAWWAGRKGARALGEGLGEALFTPEQEALENELLKIEERLSGDINRRTRQQLETRQQQVEAELELMKPLEQTQPINPTNEPIMVKPTEETETESTPGPLSQDGTPTQEVMSNQKSETLDLTSLEDLILMQTTILNDIKRNTKATVSGIGDISNS